MSPVPFLIRTQGCPPNGRARSGWLCLALLLAWAGFPVAAATEGADADGFTRLAQPFIRDHCTKCHGPEKQKGKVRLDTLAADFLDPATASKWAEVVNAVNRREMPPKEEAQPATADTARFAEWIEAGLARAEIARRSTRVVLRRLNRAEYDHTIRDLVGLDFNPAEKFPEDPSAGGFDNVGQALSMSPMQVELYYAAARQILDRALVDGPQPRRVTWHFEPEENQAGMDRHRVERDGTRILLNPGANGTEHGFTVVHHDSWDRGIGFRDFKVPTEGEYVIRFRAAGRIPTRQRLVESARALLEKRCAEEDAKDPARAKGHRQQLENDLKHFETHRMYDFGPPRVKVVQHLDGTPRVVAELDIEAPESAPRVYEVKAYFTTKGAGIELNYAYDLPSVLENFWMQRQDGFARPVLLVDWIELEGPIHDSWPPASHRRILPESGLRETDEPAYAREVLSRFMGAAYRRPLRPGEVEARVKLFTRIRGEKPGFVEAIKVPLAATLVSPHFLYLAEPDSDPPRPLNPYELASRLSYFLWSSMPDDELSRLAASGEILQPSVLAAQATRMMEDPRIEAFVANFAGQWLGLRKVGANPPARNLYPEYDRHLETSMVRETLGFFAEVLRHDLDARNFLKSDFVTINERLARFYGVPGVRGDAIRRVSVTPESHRGGIVTQASIQSLTSNGTRTSPVVRGAWVLRTLLGLDPGLPVANVGEIQSKVPGIDKATVRRRLAIHRENASCARCHDKIDPLGLAMENYDACGEWRDREGHGYQGRIERDDPVIDASARMPDGTEFKGVEGLQAQLLKQEDLFLNTLASQLYTYALGRELGFSDRPTVRASVATMKQDDYRLRTLVREIVGSKLFATK
jgi:mono/diheme cytochrome c family protein